MLTGNFGFDVLVVLLFLGDEKYFFSRYAGFLPLTEASIISGLLFAIDYTPLYIFICTTRKPVMLQTQAGTINKMQNRISSQSVF